MQAPPPPYEDWFQVPDTSQLPPPPSIQYQTSPAANASANESDRAHAWTAVNPLWRSQQLSESHLQALSIGFASIVRPREFRGEIEAMRQRPGTWAVQPSRQCADCCLLSTVPMYSALHGAPKYGAKQIAYFEIRVGEMGDDAGIAIGFIAPPYPSWRLPGWERASLGVHGDDGRRYVNDTWGGMDFTSPFQSGDVVGIGIEFPVFEQSQVKSKRDLQDSPARVFFSRNGAVEKSWDLHEEIDSKTDRPGGVTGLEGVHDLFAAIGVYGASDFEIRFARHNWQLRL